MYKVRLTVGGRDELEVSFKVSFEKASACDLLLKPQHAAPTKQFLAQQPF